MSDILAATHHYRNNGLNPIPVSLKSKKPIVKWKPYQSEPLTDIEVDRYFNQDVNVGIVCGGISGNLLVLDYDNRSTFASHRTELRHILENTWVVNSGGRSGGKHVYLRTTQPVTTRKTAGLDIKAEGGFVVAPPSLHSSGRQYQFDSRQLTIFEHRSDNIYLIEDLAELDFLGLDLQFVGPDNRKPYGVPLRLWQLLTTGQFAGYASRSEADQAIITHLVNMGWPFEAIETIFLRHSPAPQRYRGVGKGQDYLKRSHESALRRVALFRKDTHKFIDNVEAFAAHRNWSGRTGLTDQAVFSACLEICKASGKTEFAASSRDIAEKTGIGRVTATNALSRLCQAKLIGRLSRHEKYETNVFQLKKVPKVDIPSHILRGVNGSLMALFNKSHDVWRHRALGKTGFEIWRLVEERQPIKSGDLEGLTVCGRRTLYRKLELMRKLCVLVKGKSGWTVNPDVNFDEVAQELGQAGVGEKQRQRHDKERIAYRLQKEFWEEGDSAQNDRTQNPKDDYFELQDRFNSTLPFTYGEGKKTP